MTSCVSSFLSSISASFVKPALLTGPSNILSFVKSCEETVGDHAVNGISRGKLTEQPYVWQSRWVRTISAFLSEASQRLFLNRIFSGHFMGSAEKKGHGEPSPHHRRIQNQKPDKAYQRRELLDTGIGL